MWIAESKDGTSYFQGRTKLGILTDLAQASLICYGKKETLTGFEKYEYGYIMNNVGGVTILVGEELIGRSNTNYYAIRIYKSGHVQRFSGISSP